MKAPQTALPHAFVLPRKYPLEKGASVKSGRTPFFATIPSDYPQVSIEYYVVSEIVYNSAHGPERYESARASLGLSY